MFIKLSLHSEITPTCLDIVFLSHRPEFDLIIWEDLVLHDTVLIATCAYQSQVLSLQVLICMHLI